MNPKLRDGIERFGMWAILLGSMKYIEANFKLADPSTFAWAIGVFTMFTLYDAVAYAKSFPQVQEVMCKFVNYGKKQ